MKRIKTASSSSGTNSSACSERSNSCASTKGSTGSSKPPSARGAVSKSTALSVNSKAPTTSSVSKSQDNLASTLRKKAVASNLQEKNKENIKISASPLPMSARGKIGRTPIRKAQSAHSIENSVTPIKRAQSAHCITKTSNTSGKSVKKAASTQNISHGTKQAAHQMRITDPVNIVAYNAQLLASFEKEKRVMERRISELIQLAENRKTEIEKLKFEVRRLKEESGQEHIAILQSENCTLKDKLLELGVSVEHVTDQEKLSMLATSCLTMDKLDFDRDLCDKLDASSINVLEHDYGDSCITPEHASSLSLDNSNWDKQSNKSSDAMSEVSVACLQDRILQMEETHYSTNEELQATLQELGDLQDSVNELSYENERLADERSVLLESLCAQTEKLENCRMQIEHLKALLVQESEGADRSENERQLVALVRSSHEERDELLLRQMELSNALSIAESDGRELQDIINALRDRSNIQEMRCESLQKDKRSLENSVAEVKETLTKDQIELQRLNTLLERERGKVCELERLQGASNKTEIEQLLMDARQEKDTIEALLTNAQKELALSSNQLAKLNEHCSMQEEELKVSKNNAKGQLSDLQYKIDRQEQEKVEMKQQIDALRDHIDQLQLDCDRYLEDKKERRTQLEEIEQNLRLKEGKISELEQDIRNIREKHQNERDQWLQFQQDLQTAVVIANDFKMEAQEDIEKILSDSSVYKDIIDRQKQELEDLKKENEVLRQNSEIQSSSSDIRGRVISTVDRELAVLRKKTLDGVRNVISVPNSPAAQSQSVKHLIASIEQQSEANKQVKTTPPLSPAVNSQNSSRRSSSDSLKSPDSSSKIDRRDNVHILKSALKKTPIESKEVTRRLPLSDIIYEKSPLMNEDTTRSETDGKSFNSFISNKNRRNSVTENEKVDKPAQYVMKSDPLSFLAKQMGGSKRNALLKWCQNKTKKYPGIDITNFSSSWNDGLAFCAILHSYLPNMIAFKELSPNDQRRNFMLAFQAAESVGIPSILKTADMVAMERPDWQAVMTYVTSIYKHFELDNKHMAL